MDCSTNNFPEINAIHRLWDRACINPAIKYREDFSALPPLYLFYLPPFCFFFLFFFSNSYLTPRIHGARKFDWNMKIEMLRESRPVLVATKKRRFYECLSNADELENTIQRFFFNVKSYLSFELHYSWKKFDVSLLERRNLMLFERTHLLIKNMEERFIVDSNIYMKRYTYFMLRSKLGYFLGTKYAVPRIEIFDRRNEYFVFMRI